MRRGSGWGAASVRCVVASRAPRLAVPSVATAAGVVPSAATLVDPVMYAAKVAGATTATVMATGAAMLCPRAMPPRLVIRALRLRAASRHIRALT